METPSEDDNEAWLRRLPKSTTQASGEPWDDASALREALRLEDAEMRQAANNDVLGRARLFRRLEATDVLGSPVGTVPKRPTRAHYWVAAAACVASLAIVLQFVGPWSTESRPDLGGEMRGVTATVQISSPEPAAEARLRLRELRMLGLKAHPVEVKDRYVIEVDIDASQLETFRGWSRALHASAPRPGRYRIIISDSSGPAEPAVNPN